MHRFSKVAPYLLLLVPGLVFLILNVRAPDELDYLYWEMAFVLSVPIMLVCSVAVLIETIDWFESRNKGLFGKK
jgi:hypothetical protein